MTDVNALTQWLREQIAETRQLAEAAAQCGPSPWTAAGERNVSYASGRTVRETVVATYDKRGIFNQWDRIYIKSDLAEKLAEHVAMQHPAAVLAQCDAHTAILDLHLTRSDGRDMCNEDSDPNPCGTARALGLAYQHRPGYREEWRP